MYSFDESEEAAQETYSIVCQAYERILQRLRLPVVKGKTMYYEHIHVLSMLIIL